MEQQNEVILILIVLGIVFLALMKYFHKTQTLQSPQQKQEPTLILFLLFAAIGFAIRAAFAYTMPGYVTDVDCFRAWSDYAYSGGLEYFYDGAFFADYPPLYVYVLSFLGWLRNLMGMDIMGADYALVIKMPAILTDLLLAAFVYFVAKKEINGRAGLFLSALILFNPAVMMNSVIWGQVDVLVTIMLVVTVYLLYKNRLIFAAAVFMLAFLLKPQAIILAPLLLFVLIRNIVTSERKWKGVLTLAASVGVMAAIFFIAPLPFGVNREPLWLIQRFLETMGQYPQASLNAFNVYSMFGLNFLNAADYSFLGLPLNIWGFVFIGIVCLYALWLYLRNPDKKFLFALAAFIMMGVFAFGHGMHERYLFTVPVLLLMAYIFLRDRRLFTCTLLVFGVLLVNQGVSLYFYQSMLPTALTVFLSAASMAIFVYTIYVITALALKPPVVERQRMPEPVEKKEQIVRMRLEEFQTKKTIHRKDWFIMLVITAIYACVAFTNLGATEIPSTSSKMDQAVVVAFSQPEHITTLKYYADYGSAEFEVFSSEDGVNYYPVALTKSGETQEAVTHELGNLYKWQVYTADFTAPYVKISPISGELPILEVAFYNAEGTLVAPVSVTKDGQTLTEWTDEQALVPEQPTYMTDFYFDEIYHVRTAYENIHGITPYEITHPPLGKIIIASGIELFGMNPFGWRFMGTLAGTLMLPVIYILAKLLLKKRKYAVFATVLFAADFMHFAQTRIGTVDSYSILWIMLMYLFMYLYTQTNFNRQGVGKTLIPLFLCGLFFGIGAATKWLCIYAGLGLLVIYVLMMYRRYREYRYAKESGEHPEVVEGYRKKLAVTLLASVAFFIVIPAGIYLLSYLPYTLVTDGGAYGLKEIIGNQDYMLHYHAYLNPDHVHPFSSKWYTWPADIRPVLFFSNQDAQAGTVATLSTMGNPLIWWTGIVAVVSLAAMTICNKKYRRFGILFLAVAALSQFAPWWFITREVFIYHYFAVVPFLILLTVYWLKFMEERYRYGRVFGYAFVIACVAMFFFFYPVITGVPAPAEYVNGLRWIESWPFY